MCEMARSVCMCEMALYVCVCEIATHCCRDLCMCTPQAQCMQVVGYVFLCFVTMNGDACMVRVYAKRATHSIMQLQAVQIISRMCMCTFFVVLDGNMSWDAAR